MKALINVFTRFEELKKVSDSEENENVKVLTIVTASKRIYLNIYICSFL